MVCVVGDLLQHRAMKTTSKSKIGSCGDVDTYTPIEFEPCSC